MIDLIMSHPSFRDKPPVLFDIGASGDIHKIWRSIAKYCICVAFDPDERDVAITEKSGNGFKHFYLINRAVSNFDGHLQFFLTDSPHCSSTLETDMKSLSKYEIASSFEIKKSLNMQAISVGEALNLVNIDYIDWYKTDTQGTDLKIFRAIDNSIADKIIIAEFEPGILDAYKGEDKLYSIMEYFDTKKSFFCDECVIKGMARISEKKKNELFNKVEKRFFHLFLKKTGFWAEISYFNEMNNKTFEKRDFLLAIAFALLKKQYGYVLELSEMANQKFAEDEIFDLVQKYAIKKMKTEGWTKFIPYVIKKIFEKATW